MPASVPVSPPRADAVTSFRREVKFVYRCDEAARLAAMLDARCEPVRFGENESSEVNSIYFDDDRLTSVSESLAGVSRRIKLRLRWYDAPLARDRAFFEIKRRNGLSI